MIIFLYEHMIKFQIQISKVTKLELFFPSYRDHESYIVVLVPVRTYTTHMLVSYVIKYYYTYCIGIWNDGIEFLENVLPTYPTYVYFLKILTLTRILKIIDFTFNNLTHI